MTSGDFDEEEQEEEVFLDDDDIIAEIPVDEEDLPDVDDEGHDDSIHVFTGHTGEIYAIACSPTDPSIVATGGGDDKGYLWKIGRADWGSELNGHGESVSAIAFSSDGLLLASGDLNGLIQIWDSYGSRRCSLEGPDKGILWIKWHPRGHIVLAGSEDSTIWMWNVDKNTYLNVFSGHADSVTCGDFTPDGRTVCSGSDDASIRIWNPKTGDGLRIATANSNPDESGVTCMAITADSTVLVAGSKDGSVFMVSISTGKMIGSLYNHGDSVECIGICSSQPWLATGGLDQKVMIWDLQRSSLRCSCEHEGGVTCLSWLLSAQYLASGSTDGRIRIWDALSGNCMRVFDGHSDAVQSLAISVDGDHLVSCSLDHTARVFEISEFR